MGQLVNVITDKCHGCTSCIDICPVEDANIAYLVNDEIKIHIDPDKCIACGACIKVCPHNARYYNDDTESFFSDLINNEQLALIVAPAFSKNFTNWQSILSWLRFEGVSLIIDVAFGISICTWAYVRYIENYHCPTLITQPCPPIVNYIDKNCPQLSKILAPIYSPILCTAIYLKKVMKIPHKIAALTPCIAKKNEFEKIGIINYNVTFSNLADYIMIKKVNIPQADFEYDHIGFLNNKVNGIADNLLLSINDYININLSKLNDQTNIYKYLSEIENLKDTTLTLDALNCIEGCNHGTGCNLNCQNRHNAHTNMNTKQLYDNQQEQFYIFDNNLELFNYLKTPDCDI